MIVPNFHPECGSHALFSPFPPLAIIYFVDCKFIGRGFLSPRCLSLVQLEPPLEAPL